jgi:LPS export ABC transporter permease LptG/LPS export ABC transporter permease LptF
MRILDKYIIREIIPPALLAMIIFTFVMVMNKLLLLADMLIQKGVGIGEIAKMLIYILPSIISLTIPMAVLLGIIIGLNRLASDSEIVAIRAGGVSVYKLMVPIMLFSLCMWMINSFVMIYALPKGNTKLLELQYKIVTSHAILKDVRPRIFNEDIPNQVIYITDISEDKNWWKKIFICRKSSENVPGIILAEKGTPFQDKKSGSLALRLYNGTLYETNIVRPQKNNRISNFSQLNISLSEGMENLSEAAQVQKDERSMTIGELWQNMQKKKGKNFLKATIINKGAKAQWITIQLLYDDEKYGLRPLLNSTISIKPKRGRIVKLPYYLPLLDQSSDVRIKISSSSTDNKSAVLFEKTWDKKDLIEEAFGNKQEFLAVSKLDNAGFRINGLIIGNLNQPEDYRSLLVEIHKKFSIPFACIIFGILGLPLGLSFQRAGKSAGYVLGLVIFLIYYVLLMNGEVLADKGKVSPFLGMWAANIVFGIVGIIMLFHRARAAYLFSNMVYYCKQGFQNIGKIFKKEPKKKSQEQRQPRRASSTIVIRLPRLGWKFPNILDRYVLITFIKIYLLVFICVYSVFALVDFVDINEEIERHQLSYSLMGEYFKFKFPQILSYIIPITTLMAVLITLAILSKFREILAIKAAGISIYRVFLPLIVIAVFASGFAFLLEDNILPYSNRRLSEVTQKIKGGPAQTFHQFGSRWLFGKKNRIFHYFAHDPKQEIFNKFSIFDYDAETFTLTRRLFAQEAKLDSSADKWSGFADGWIQTFKPGEVPQLETFEFKESIGIIEKPSYFRQEFKLPDEMNYSELSDYIMKLRGLGFNTLQHRVDLHWKVSFPFLSLIFVLMGMPFSLKIERKGTLTGIFVSIALVVVYWNFMVAFKNLGYAGILPPWLAAWAPNIIFGIIGGYLILETGT